MIWEYHIVIYGEFILLDTQTNKIYITLVEML